MKFIVCKIAYGKSNAKSYYVVELGVMKGDGRRSENMKRDDAYALAKKMEG